MYLYIKAVHVFAVMMFISGMVLLAFALRYASTTTPPDAGAMRFIKTVQAWDSLATTPALATVWVAGFTMAFGAGWDRSLWLMAKLVSVLFLSGFHSYQAVALRRMIEGRANISAPLRWAPALIFIAFALIVFLVVLKPF